MMATRAVVPALLASVCVLVSCATGEDQLVEDAAEYVEDHSETLTSDGFETDEIEQYVIELCLRLRSDSDPARYLAREAGPEYWAWNETGEPFEERNSPDEPFQIAREVCAYDVVEALDAGYEIYGGESGASPDEEAVPSDPLDQMEIAFIGNHTRSQIKERIDRAMRLYGLAVTSENYSRAGSVVVALRREYGPSEMETLDYMIRSHVPGVELTFQEAAALAVVFLASGED